MSSHKANRELLERFRFGEAWSGASWAASHVDTCDSCRREVDRDRAIEIAVRRALQERVSGGVPSRDAWAAVRRRTIGAQPRRAPLVQRLALRALLFDSSRRSARVSALRRMEPGLTNGWVRVLA
jgi:anti-sigma factor RsiW